MTGHRKGQNAELTGGERAHLLGFLATIDDMRTWTLSDRRELSDSFERAYRWRRYKRPSVRAPLVRLARDVGHLCGLRVELHCDDGLVVQTCRLVRWSDLLVDGRHAEALALARRIHPDLLARKWGVDPRAYRL